MRLKFPKRPSAYQIFPAEQQHTGCFPPPGLTPKHLSIFIHWIPLLPMADDISSKTRESQTSSHCSPHTHRRSRTHACRPRSRLALCRGDAAEQPRERLSSAGHSVHQSRRRAETRPALQSPASRVSSKAGVLPGCRSFLSGNWRQRTRVPHLIVERSPPSSSEWGAAESESGV